MILVQHHLRPALHHTCAVGDRSTVYGACRFVGPPARGRRSGHFVPWGCPPSFQPRLDGCILQGVLLGMISSRPISIYKAPEAPEAPGIWKPSRRVAREKAHGPFSLFSLIFFILFPYNLFGFYLFFLLGENSPYMHSVLCTFYPSRYKIRSYSHFSSKRRMYLTIFSMRAVYWCKATMQRVSPPVFT